MPTKPLPAILEQLSSKDIKQRHQGAINIVDYLKSGGIVELEILGDVVDVLGAGIKNSNCKISHSSIIATKELVHIFGEDFRPHTHTVLPLIIDKMGDEVQEFIQPAMKLVGAGVVFEKILPLFSDKNWRSREQALLCMTATIANFGIQSLPMQAILANMIKVLEDPIQVVRDAAVLGIEEISVKEEVGEPLRSWLQQHNLRPALLSLINEKLNSIEVKTQPAPITTNITTQPTALSRSSSSSSFYSSAATSEQTSTERSKSGSPKSMLRKLENRKSPKSERITGVGESKITPIKIISEKELNREMEDIIQVLSTQVDDWEKRQKSLQRLQGLALGGATEFPTFMSLLLRLRDPLTAQIADLRSAVAKEACATLTILSAIMGDSFEPLADNFIEVLTKSTIVTIQVISDSANKCIRAIIKQSRINRAVIKLVEGATGKNGTLRARCMEYILLLLSVAPTNALERYVDQLEATIKSGVTDAVSEARIAARSAFIMFSSHWESRGNRLLATFDTPIKKLIHEEMQKEREEFMNTTGSSSSSSSTGDRPSSGASKRSTRSTPTPPPLPPTAPAAPERVIAPGSGTLGRAFPRREPANTATTTTTTTTTSAPKMKLPEREIVPPASKPTEMVNGRANSAKATKPTRIARPEEEFPDSVGNTDVYTPDTATSIFPPETDLANVDINKLFQETESSLWSSRAEAFITLNRLVINSPSSTSNSVMPNIPRLMKIILDHLSDPHAKVVKAVLDCLLALASNYPQPLVPYLDRILPPLLVRLSGNKDEPRIQSSAVLSALLTPLRGSILLTSVLRILDVLPPKPRSAALEYMLHLIAHSQEHLTYPPHMRSMVYKILVAMGVVNVGGGAVGGGSASTNLVLTLTDPTKVGPIPPELRRAGLQCLVELYTHYRPQFLAQVLPMPVGVLFEVKKLLASCHVNVDADLATMTKTAAFSASTAPPSNTPSVLTNSSFPPPSNTNGPSRIARPPSVNSTESEKSLRDETNTELRPDKIVRPKSDDYGHLRDALKNNATTITNFGNLSLNNNSTNRNTSTATSNNVINTNNNNNVNGNYANNNNISDTMSNSSTSTGPSPPPPTPSSAISISGGTSTASTTTLPSSSSVSSLGSKKDDKPATARRKSSKPSPVKPSQSTSSPPSQPLAPQKQQPQSDVANAISIIGNTSGDARREGLHRLVKLLREDPDLVRSTWFEKMLITILECLRDDVPATRELALLVLCEMIKASAASHAHPGVVPFESFMNITVARVVEMFRDRDNAHEVKQAAEETLEHLIKVLDPMKCCSVLVALVQEEDGPVLQACIRFLAKVACRLSPQMLRHQLPVMLPGLFDAFKNTNADVRKAVVFCLVDIYLILGDEFVPYLASLSTSQKKLVTIYINRAKNKSATSENLDILP